MIVSTASHARSRVYPKERERERARARRTSDREYVFCCQNQVMGHMPRISVGPGRWGDVAEGITTGALANHLSLDLKDLWHSIQVENILQMR